MFVNWMIRVIEQEKEVKNTKRRAGGGRGVGVGGRVTGNAQCFFG
jgi:hypothetical protein